MLHDFAYGCPTVPSTRRFPLQVLPSSSTCSSSASASLLAKSCEYDDKVARREPSWKTNAREFTQTPRERVCVCVVDIGLEEEWRRIQREHRSPLIRLFTFLFVNVLPSISSLSSSAAKSSVACVSFSRFCVCVRSEMVAKGDAKERKKERRVKRHYFPVLGATRAE